jgi:hypothetical protein
MCRQVFQGFRLTMFGQIGWEGADRHPLETTVRVISPAPASMSPLRTAKSKPSSRRSTGRSLKESSSTSFH